jgi:hypothetical protein
MVIMAGTMDELDIRGGLVAVTRNRFLAEVHMDDSEAVRNIMHGSMIDAFSEVFPDAKGVDVAETKIGDRWTDVE